MFAKGKPRGSYLSNQQKVKLESSGLCNRSFDTASTILAKSNQSVGSQLRQTKLCVNQKDKKLKYEGFVEEDMPRIKAKYQFTYKPPPKNLNKNLCGIGTVTEAARAASIKPKIETVTKLPPSVSPLTNKPGRDLISLVGRVDYCLKTHKLQPELNAIWNIYGQLLKIIVGKRGEHTLLVRNKEPGPILQAIYYDFDGDLKPLKIGCFIHLVGRFKNENRLQTFRVSQVDPNIWQCNFMRIENVTSYILLQNNVQK